MLMAVGHSPEKIAPKSTAPQLMLPAGLPSLLWPLDWQDEFCYRLWSFLRSTCVRCVCGTCAVHVWCMWYMYGAHVTSIIQP